MLAVVGAVVAFDGWPDGQISTRVQTLVIDERPATIRLASADAGSSRGADRAVTEAGAPRATRDSGGQLVGDRRESGVAPGAGDGGGHQPAGEGGADGKPAVPAVGDPIEDAGPIIDAISNPGTTAGQLADGVQDATGATGVSIGQLSPELGGAVAGTGQVAAEVVRQVPLPDHVLPGH